MNPFYSHSHANHLASMSQFTTNSPPSGLSSLPHLAQHQQNHQLQNTSPQQFLQNQPQSSAAVVAAAASFYARNSGNDSFNRRMQNVSSNIPPSSSASSPSTPSNLFGGIEDSIFARAEALADISKASHHMGKQDNLYIAAVANHPSSINNHHLHSMGRHNIENNNTEIDRNNTLHHYHHQTGVALPESNNNPFYNAFYASHHHSSISPSSHTMTPSSAAAIAAAAAIHHPEIDIDPRELETFAERFKQRRIKLGVTQADVGQQLSKLKLPGVGSLSQSTICRFESLTLSHNNMIALKPVLHSWLEQAEADARNKRKNEEIMSSSSIANSISSSSTSIVSSTSNNNSSNNMNSSSSNSSHDRKRKRTSIAAPEKRSLEAFFSVQPRPSGEKIAQIADKLDLKKNVVRVWFCNQRQKQKRMKFAAIQER